MSGSHNSWEKAHGSSVESEASTADPAFSSFGADEPAQIQQDTEAESQLSRELAETKDRLLRTLAEMENLRRRTQREVEEAKTYGITSFARDMLGVADNLRRALEAIPAQERATAGQAFNALLEGVEMTERELLKNFEKSGIQKIDPQQEKFDPNLHQAMFEVPDSTVPAGTVVQVIQTGYTLGERILRPALVGVAKT